MTFNEKNSVDFPQTLNASDTESETLTVCVVDDEKFMSTYVADLVKNLNCDAITANNFDEFKKGSADRTIDVIVLDLTMPDKDGVEYLRHLYVSKFQGTIILMSGYDLRTLETVERLGRSMDLKIAGSLTKPIDHKLFAKMLKDAQNSKLEVMKPGAEPKSVTVEAIERGIAKKEFFVTYQPLVQLHENTESIFLRQYPATTMNFGSGNVEVYSLEALIRWNHPSMAIVSPNSFIPLSEESGLIGKLTASVIDMVMAQFSTWQKVGLYPRVSINYSPRLINDLTIPDYLELLAKRAGISQDRLTLEITENAVMSDVKTGMDILSRLRLKGIHLAIDDFGTGFSSLLQLYHLPFTELKIDMSLASEILHKKAADIIVEAIVKLSHELGLVVCAEGIETQDVADRLAEMNCDIVQGYLFSKPVTGDKIQDAFLMARKA